MHKAFFLPPQIGQLRVCEEQLLQELANTGQCAGPRCFSPHSHPQGHQPWAAVASEPPTCSEQRSPPDKSSLNQSAPGSSSFHAHSQFQGCLQLGWLWGAAEGTAQSVGRG